MLLLFFSQRLYFEQCGLLTRFPCNTCRTLSLSASRGVFIWPRSPSAALKRRNLTMSAQSCGPLSLNSFLKWFNIDMACLEFSASGELLRGKDVLFCLRFRRRFAPFLPACGQEEVRSRGPVWRSRERERWLWSLPSLSTCYVNTNVELRIQHANFIFAFQQYLRG